MAKTWFRIELDASGAILTCAQVDKNERDKKFVRYVEALDATEACSKVKAWYESKKKGVVERREALKSEGLCINCGKRNLEPPSNKCRPCLDSLSKRARDVRAGIHLPRRGHAGLQAAYEAHVAQGTANDRARGGKYASAYRRALKCFDALTPIEFRAWLVSEINRRSAPDKQVK